MKIYETTSEYNAFAKFMSLASHYSTHYVFSVRFL
jgi:hypothetical protein